LSRTRSDQVAHHDQPGRNADAGLQRHARFQGSKRGNQLQSRPYCPLGIVLVSARITEIHKNAIAHVFRDEPVEAAHRLGDAFLIGGNEFPQVLGVHARGKRRRADQVREHHCDMPALGGIIFGSVGFRKKRRWRCFCARGNAQKGDGVEQLTPMPDNTDAKVLQILRREVRQDRIVDRVVAECRLILFEAEAPQPTPEVHCDCPTQPQPGANDRPGENASRVLLFE
jgi:hypothetical protein